MREEARGRMSVFRKAARYARTVRHLRHSQVAWRAWYTLARGSGVGRYARAPREALEFDRDRLSGLRNLVEIWARLYPVDPAAAAALRGGRYTFLHHTVDSPGEPPWRRNDVPRLWLYHLHYFEAGRTLALANAAQPYLEDRERVGGWIRSWIDHNPPGADVAWDAFPLSARLINWAVAESVFNFREPAFRRSFAQQAAFLSRNLEYDLLGNHLLKNAVALIVAGSLLDKELLHRGLELLERELPEQILPDGGHYERSPMYHALILEDLLTAYAILAEKPGFLREVIAGMTAFLAGVCHPDGEIPLFGDAAFGQSLPPSVLVTTAQEMGTLAVRAPEVSSFESSGYYFLGREDGTARMIVKAGPPGPEYQLGHAHADLLSYELSLGDQRIIVDSGVHGYDGSPWREYCRSTRAHNTVSINGGEQLECWATFRVGRRYHVIHRQWTVEGERRRLTVAHDGFAPAGHTRTIAYGPEGLWGILDEISGRGKLIAESYIHFHPDTTVSPIAQGWLARRGSAELRVIPWGIADIQVLRGAEHPYQGWYFPEFGIAQPAPVLILRIEGVSRLRFAYAISWSGVAGVEAVRTFLEQLTANA